MKRPSFTQTGLLLATLIFLSSIFIMEVSGDTIIVAKDGSGDYDNIQEAVNNSTAGDTIEVHDGTYVENVYINKTLTLIGNGPANTAIHAYGTGSAVIINAPTTNISGFACTGSGEGYNDAGIQVNAVGGCRIEANDCSNNGRTGIYVSLADNTLVSENVASLNPHAGIWLDNSATCLVKKNDCLDSSAGFGIFMTSSDNALVDDNVCTGNSNGIAVGSSAWASIQHNDFSQSVTAISLQTSDNTSIWDNDCSDTSAYGVRVEWCTTGSITETTCVNNQMDAILIRGTTHFTISYSVGSQSSANGINFKDGSSHNYVEWSSFTDNPGAGAEVRNSAQITFLNNTVTGNDNGFQVMDSQGIEIHGCDITDNDVYGVFAQSSSQATVDATDNEWGFISGPYHETTNTEGEGNDVSDLVIYDPWKRKGDPPPNTKPRVTWMYPHAGDEVDGTQQITIWARDEDGNETLVIVQIAFVNATWNSTWQDMELNDDDPDNLRWLINWKTKDVNNGDYTVQARAYDNIIYSRTMEFAPLKVRNTDDDDDDEDDDSDIVEAILVAIEWFCSGGCFAMNISIVFAFMTFVRKKEQPQHRKLHVPPRRHSHPSLP